MGRVKRFYGYVEVPSHDFQVLGEDCPEFEQIIIHITLKAVL